MQNTLQIRKGQADDFDRIMSIYHYAQEFMIRSGNPTQWGHFYPEPEMIRRDIDEGNCHVIFDQDGVHGVFALFEGEDPTYAYIENGTWLNDDPYVTIHRIAGDGQAHGIFRCAAEYCAGLGVDVRIDTHADNTVMQRQIEKNGFVKCGIIYIEDGSPRIAYQRTAQKKEYGFYGWKEAVIRDTRGLTPCGYYDLLSRIWAPDTCTPRMRQEWAQQHPTWGQCSVTAFIMQDIYGGKVRGVLLEDGSIHCFNDVDGCVFDLTSEQFGKQKLDYTSCPEQLREVHFKKEEKRQRYELLKERLMKEVTERYA